MSGPARGGLRSAAVALLVLLSAACNPGSDGAETSGPALDAGAATTVEPPASEAAEVARPPAQDGGSATTVEPPPSEPGGTGVARPPAPDGGDQEAAVDGNVAAVEFSGRQEARFGFFFLDRRREPTASTDTAGPLEVQRVYDNLGGPPRSLTVTVRNTGAAVASNVVVALSFEVTGPIARERGVTTPSPDPTAEPAASEQTDASGAAGERETLRASGLTVGDLVDGVPTAATQCTTTGFTTQRARSTCTLGTLGPEAADVVRVTFARAPARADLAIDVTVSAEVRAD